MRTLFTKRLKLRALQESDLNDFYAYAKKENIGPSAGWLPHKSVETSYAILIGMIKEDDVFAIIFKETDRLIGTIGLHKKEDDKLNVREIGYVLDDIYWGQGIIPEAVKAVIDYSFLVENVDRLLCAHFDFNIRSKRVIEKSGFTFYQVRLRENAYHELIPSNEYYLNNPYRGE